MGEIRQQPDDWTETQLKRARVKKVDVDEEKDDEMYTFDGGDHIEFGGDEKLVEMTEISELIDIAEQKEFDLIDTKQKLPIYQERTRVMEMIKENQVIILVGETGSGKTTQLPQYIVEDGYGRVCCTQPRRVAAMSVAARVADEMGTKVGDKVGYSVRFDERSSKRTVLKYSTDGMLVREMMGDLNLSKYGVIMVDEAHERTIHTDILLGLLKELISKRKDLKIVISSATLDAEKFSLFFNNASIVTVKGRRFPVDIYYTIHPEASYLKAAIASVLQIHGSGAKGDILVFLTGQEEIELFCEALSEIDTLDVLPLYASLQPDQQKLVFEKTNNRKVVASTNIAETSLTIDGIVFVIDSGMVKQKKYDPSNDSDSLVVASCSKASADQRAGRAGRVQPGKCFRLYTKESYNEMAVSPTPEILRSELTSIVLSLLSMNITNIMAFPFMDRPSAKGLARSLSLLYALGALNSKGQLTTIGIKLSALPLTPMIGRTILAASENGVVDDVIAIVSLFDESPFINPKKDTTNKTAAKAAQRQFANTYKAGGDPLALLALWEGYHTSGYSNQWCHDHWVDARSMRRARDVRKQLQRICRTMGLYYGTINGDVVRNGEKSSHMNINDKTISIMKSLCRGLFPHKGVLSDITTCTYSTAAGPATLHPSSVLQGTDAENTPLKPPRTVVFQHVIRTSRNFIYNVMPVMESWIDIREFK
ncbi:hypothetical protein DAPK24_006060 [Pichia kluyveri]|uniref:RNA helicase n=1 Tax=Pichia kluyveri TaxID=36015 RepID=A0AAV5QYJ7_PICKL|nr:hypothetical protein DAPK24_006060 [Pichia kluyveri]